MTTGNTRWTWQDKPYVSIGTDELGNVLRLEHGRARLTHGPGQGRKTWHFIYVPGAADDTGNYQPGGWHLAAPTGDAIKNLAQHAAKLLEES